MKKYYQRGRWLIYGNNNVNLMLWNCTEFQQFQPYPKSAILILYQQFNINDLSSNFGQTDLIARMVLNMHSRLLAVFN